MEATRAFRGRTTKEVIFAIKQELGEDAVIVATRNIRDSRSTQIEIIAAPATTTAQVPLTPAVESLAPKGQFIDTLRRNFELNGLHATISETIIDEYKSRASQFESLDPKALEKALEALQPYGAPRTTERRVLALLGPTGVGKTTTIAKLAAIATLKGRTAGLITIDTRRIGAVAQLSSYATLINLPMRSASNAQELRAALLAFGELDQVFIDTAGSSPWDMERLRELTSILDCGIEFERMLLVPASGNAPDLDRIVRTFAALDVTRVGITKIDETCYFGPCFGCVVSAGLPLELFGNGPNVPEDIEYASAKRVLELLSRVRH